jgi:hypothetical protein
MAMGSTAPDLILATSSSTTIIIEYENCRPAPLWSTLGLEKSSSSTSWLRFVAARRLERALAESVFVAHEKCEPAWLAVAGSWLDPITICYVKS